ncbi:unnamed protein product [Effrenium voratum]|nr:unnamed protein product [Effrenium voratum]
MADLGAAFGAERLAKRLRRLADIAEEEDLAVDVYGASGALQSFEAEVALDLGKEAGLCFPTGTLAQLAALHCHFEAMAQPQGRLLLHPTSHLIHRDYLRDAARQSQEVAAKTRQALPMFRVQLVGHFAKPLALSDLEGVFESGDVLVVELPQRMNGGRTPSWPDLQALRALARKAKARLHLDGARLFEAQPYYQLPVSSLCGLFDSVYLSWYKGFGGLAGAILLSTRDVISSAARWRTQLGGNVFTLAPGWMDARAQFRLYKDSFAGRYLKLCRVVRALMEEDAVREVLRFEPEVPEACMVHGYVKAAEEEVTAAHERVVAKSQIRLWNKLRGPGFFPGETYFELSMGPQNGAIPEAVYLEGWPALGRTFRVGPHAFRVRRRAMQHFVAFQRRFPAAASATVGFTVMGLGDASVQAMEGGSAYDPQRGVVVSAYNGGMSPLFYFWWQYLDKIWAGTSLAAVARKTLCNQVVIAPFNSALFLTWSTALGSWIKSSEHSTSSVREKVTLKLKTEVPDLVKSSCGFWLPANAANFMFVPKHFRVLFMSSCAVLWGGYISFVAHR